MILCLLPIIAGIIIYPKLPEMVPTHWNFKGEIDDYSSRFTAVFLLPGIFFIVNLLTPLLLKIDPKNANMNSALQGVFIWMIPVMSVVCCFFTYAGALGYDLPIELVVPMLCGLLFVIVGNYLPKTRQNYTMGIKVPWTLNSEENWNRTHRLGGFVWVAAGIILIIGAMVGKLLPEPVVVISFIVAILAMLFIPVIYSFILYKRGI